MRNVLTIAAKELRSYLVSPVAWVVATVFLVISGWFFNAALQWYAAVSLQLTQDPSALHLANVNRMVFEPLFQNLAVVLLLLVPLVTMRLLAEEKKNRTAHLLFTSPVRLGEIIAGKFAAAVALLAAVLLLTLYMPLLAWTHGSIDWGPIFCGYLGMILLTAAFAAWGLFASSLTENQIVASVISFCLLLIFWALGWVAPQDGGTLGTVIEQLSLGNHVEGFFRGVVELKDVIFYLSAAALPLFLTHRVLDSARWR